MAASRMGRLQTSGTTRHVAQSRYVARGSQYIRMRGVPQSSRSGSCELQRLSIATRAEHFDVIAFAISRRDTVPTLTPLLVDRESQ